MIKPIEVKIIDENKIFVSYSDGLEGEISVDHLSTQKLFEFVNDKSELEKVYIDPLTSDLCWPNGANLCKNAIYKQLELKALIKRLKIDIDKL
jgi:hypothetical protein